MVFRGSERGSVGVKRVQRRPQLILKTNTTTVGNNVSQIDIPTSDFAKT